VHMHLIPRRKGDIDNPQGGVRGVIPNRRTYTRKVKGSQ
jgi:diadenosine tetraphosphate (Ap4A) HIT family hydrolase